MPPHLSRSALIRLLSGEAVQTEVDRMVPHLVACRPCWELAAQIVAELKKDNALARTPDARSAVLILLEEEEKAALDLLRARAWWPISRPCHGTSRLTGFKPWPHYGPRRSS